MPSEVLMERILNVAKYRATWALIQYTWHHFPSQCYNLLTHCHLRDVDAILKNIIFNLVLLVSIFKSSHDNALWWMPQDLTDDKSTLVQVMAWCHQATSHYLNQCWPRSLPPYGVTRPQYVNLMFLVPFFPAPLRGNPMLNSSKERSIVNITRDFHNYALPDRHYTDLMPVIYDNFPNLLHSSHD